VTGLVKTNGRSDRTSSIGQGMRSESAITFRLDTIPVVSFTWRKLGELRAPPLRNINCRLI
jgi:hypothetical protein